jgi:hypothetical protein
MIFPAAENFMSEFLYPFLLFPSHLFGTGLAASVFWPGRGNFYGFRRSAFKMAENAGHKM